MIQRLLNLIPRFRAEDALLASTVAAVGSGTVKNGKEILAEWQRRADAGRRRDAQRTWMHSLKQIQAMGVAVEITKAPPRE